MKIGEIWVGKLRELGKYTFGRTRLEQYYSKEDAYRMRLLDKDEMPNEMIRTREYILQCYVKEG